MLPNYRSDWLGNHNVETTKNLIIRSFVCLRQIFEAMKIKILIEHSKKNQFNNYFKFKDIKTLFLRNPEFSSICHGRTTKIACSLPSRSSEMIEVIKCQIIWLLLLLLGRMRHLMGRSQREVMMRIIYRIKMVGSCYSFTNWRRTTCRYCCDWS